MNGVSTKGYPSYREATATEEAQYATKQLYKAEHDRCASVVRQTQAELAEAEKAPPPVIQPLPEATGEALAVLCFAYMDSVAPSLRVLGKLSFSAQEALHPNAHADSSSPSVNLNWVSHHDKQQLSSSYFRPKPPLRAGKQGELQLWSREDVPRQVGPQHVDHCKTPRDGVWHPQGFQLHWYGRDPFQLPPRETLVQLYTEPLPRDYESLQWVVPQDDRLFTRPTRGTEAVAKQADSPPWLTRPQYLAFCGVRSAAFLQLRSVCCALRERSLPFQHPAVQLLLRQALLQVGIVRTSSGDSGGGGGATRLSPLPPTELAWKAELSIRGSGSLMETLQSELRGLADELGDAISNHQALLAVIDAAVYLRHWDEEPAAGRGANDLRWACVDITRRRV